ncbi:MAG TPA: hypothetical protein VMO88_00685, partial [Acidimicrobiales bacterium]|nr:hypothetical protein [Acidimicrobiales bacterium]
WFALLQDGVKLAISALEIGYSKLFRTTSQTFSGKFCSVRLWATVPFPGPEAGWERAFVSVTDPNRSRTATGKVPYSPM